MILSRVLCCDNEFRLVVAASAASGRMPLSALCPQPCGWAEGRGRRRRSLQADLPTDV